MPRSTENDPVRWTPEELEAGLSVEKVAILRGIMNIKPLVDLLMRLALQREETNAQPEPREPAGAFAARDDGGARHRE